MAKKQNDKVVDTSINYEKLVKEAMQTTVRYEEESLADTLSTGSLAIDLILGGGIRPGTRMELDGKERSGKSNLLYSIFSSACADGIYSLFYDYEGTTEPYRLLNQRYPVDILSKDTSKYKYTKDLEYGEEAFDKAHGIMKQLPSKGTGKAPMLYMVDSLPAMVPRAVVEGETNQLNRKAAMFAEKLPLIKGTLARKRCIWVDTNHVRFKPVAFGNPEYSPGGEAVKHLSDYRLKTAAAQPPKHVKNKEGILELEKNLTGGIDRYAYTTIKVDKTKSYVCENKCLLRILISTNGEPRGVYDFFYDVYEFLRLTNQVTTETVRGKGRMLTFYFDGIEHFNSDMLYQKHFDTNGWLTLGWLDTKAFVLKNYDYIYGCLRETLKTGKAQNLYESRDRSTSSDDTYDADNVDIIDQDLKSDDFDLENGD